MNAHAEIPIAELDESALDAAADSVRDDVSDERVVNKRCGASGTADDNVCHVETQAGEEAFPFGLKKGDQFFYAGETGPEVFRAHGWNNGFMTGEVVSVRGVKPGDVLPVDYGRIVTKQEAEGIASAEAYLDGESSGLMLHELAERSHLETGTINQIMASWADSSNDHDPISLHIQQLSADLLGAHLSNWQEVRLKDTVRQYTHGGFTAAETKERGEMLKAMYDWTQEELADHGIEGVTLYRGIMLPSRKDDANKATEVGEKVNLSTNAIESWTSDYHVAETFARAYLGRGIVVKATIPADQVLSTHRTGFGVRGEREWTVINTQPITATVTKQF